MSGLSDYEPAAGEGLWQPEVARRTNLQSKK